MSYRATWPLVVPALCAAVAEVRADPQRCIAVASFRAPAESRARQAVLDTLSDHSDIEVVSLEDLEFASHRVHVELQSASGRAKVSNELGISAWLDGTVDGSHAALTLTAVDGTRLREVNIDAPSPRLLDALVAERMWAALGAQLSDKERLRRVRLKQAELARTKIAARQKEFERQVGLARDDAARRVTRLRAEQARALAFQVAIAAELNHQRLLVAEARRKQQEADEALWQAELERQAREAAAAKAEKERQLALAEKQRREAEAEKQRQIAQAEREGQQAEAERQRQLAAAEKEQQLARAAHERQMEEAERQRRLAAAEQQRLLAEAQHERELALAEQQRERVAEAERQRLAELQERQLLAAEQERKLAEAQAERERAVLEQQHQLALTRQQRALAEKQRELLEQKRLLAEAQRQHERAQQQRELAQQQRQTAEAQRLRLLNATQQEQQVAARARWTSASTREPVLAAQAQARQATPSVGASALDEPALSDTGTEFEAQPSWQGEPRGQSAPGSVSPARIVNSNAYGGQISPATQRWLAQQQQQQQQLR